MGQFLNKGNDGFASVLRSGYVDKSGLIAKVNENLFTEGRYMCVTRSRRFGKSVAAKMLNAYYDKSLDSRALFDGLQITKDPSFNQYLNSFPVVRALKRKRIESYWAGTNAFEDLKGYITMNFDGLKDDVLRLIAGDEVPVNTTMFSNDLREIKCKDDVLTVLCHLGYLSYNWDTRMARIPNYEVRQEFENTLPFLLVGVNYDKATKKHECKIERVSPQSYE